MEVLNQNAVCIEMRALRRAHRLSRAEVGRRLGRTRSYISLLELGKGWWTPARVKRYRAAVEKEAR
jgi:transcriptional regulator with XRE-family HTH domain